MVENERQLCGWKGGWIGKKGAMQLDAHGKKPPLRNNSQIFLHPG